MKWLIAFLIIGWALTAGLWKEDHRHQQIEKEKEKEKGEARFDFVVSYYRTNYSTT